MSELSSYRNSLNISQNVAAKTLGVSLRTYQRYEASAKLSGNKLDSIKDKKVAVELGSAGEAAAEGVSNLNKVTSQEAALLEVKAGTSDCAIIDVTMANAVVGKGDFTDLATVSADNIVFEKEDFGVGVRKNSNLTAKLDAFFKDSYKSGLLTTLSNKYNVAINDATLK